MRGYLSIKGNDNGIPLEERVEVYRDPEEEREIVAETSERTVALGIADMTVSRKKNDEAPIVIEPRSEHIEIRNEGNSNGLTVISSNEEIDIEEGFLKRVRRDTQLKIGYQTILQLQVEREAREEYIIEGDVETEGDILMGDATKIDESTTVEDSVVNRSNIGRGGTDVEDSVVNRSNIGEDAHTGRSHPSGNRTPARSDDTRQFCKEHQTSYTDRCPECAKADGGASSADAETKYCIYCGASIPAAAIVCPDCGKEQKDT